MAGGISGAFLGLSQLPSYFVEMVHDRGTWKFAELKELTLACYQLKKTVPLNLDTQPHDPQNNDNA